MLRRQFLQLGAAAAFAQRPTDSITAGATEDKTIRVGLVQSSFRDTKDHYGAEVQGLSDPRAVTADLTDAQFDAMARKALEFGTRGKLSLAALLETDDWVMIKCDVSACGSAGSRFVPGSITDLRLVRSLIGYLVEKERGARITVAESLGGCDADLWASEWDGAFGGLSYKKMVAEFARARPNVKFELADLDQQPAMAAPVEGAAVARRNTENSYFIPKMFQQCDKVISVAPLKVHTHLGVSLTFGNYFNFAAGSKYGSGRTALEKLGEPAEIAVDLFRYHPADYAILGGSWGMDGGGSVHHNVIVAGANAVAVDAVGSAVMGFAPAEIPFLRMAKGKGLGDPDVDALWVRGHEIEEARRPFRPAAGWAKPAARSGK